MATTLTPSAIGTDYSYASIVTNYPLSGVIGNGSSSSGYYGINLNTGSNAESYFYLLFDTSAIPATATINSIACNVKVYNSSNAINRTGTRNVQLYSGSTPKGSAKSWGDTGTITFAIDNVGQWTRAELNNLALRFYYKRNSTQTTTSTQVYVQGVDITIEWEDKPLVKHTLTISTNGYNVTPAEGGEYNEGTIVPITINADTLPQITLDGNNITSLFVEKRQDAVLVSTPTAATSTGLSSGSNQVTNAVGRTAENPYTGSNNWYGSNSGAVDSQYAQYTFNVSTIPSNATNIRVACKVAGKAESTTYSHQSGGRYSVWALCSNGVTKSEQIHATKTTVEVLEFADTGSWTREELNGLQLRHYVGYYGGSTNGVTLTITYELPSTGNEYSYDLTMDADHVLVFGSNGEKMYVKQGGTWVEVSKVWQKQDGTWVEVNDIHALFADADSGTNSGYFIDK